LGGRANASKNREREREKSEHKKNLHSNWDGKRKSRGSEVMLIDEKECGEKKRKIKEKKGVEQT
jgi:hypothetical protein